MKNNKPPKKQKSKDKSKPKTKQEEHLSFEDWEEIMNMNMDRYVRKNGAWRRK